MRKSKLFGERELELLEQRIKGNKKDTTGLWARKVKPKVIELLDWMPRKKELKKSIEVKDAKK